MWSQLSLHCLSRMCEERPGGPKVTADEARPGFSFAVYGDSRSMMYLPYRSDQEEEAGSSWSTCLNSCFQQKVAEEVVKKHVKLTYDPATKELVQIVMPFDTASEVTTLDAGQGLGHRGLGRGRETAAGRAPHDVPAARRRLGRPRGREGCPERAGQVHSQYRGHGLVGQAGTHALRNPYWKLVNEDVLKQLPAPDHEMRAAGLPGSRFPCCRQSRSVGRLRRRGPVEAFPYLKQFGVSDKQLIYKFDFNGARFIFLWTGKYDYRSPSAWDATGPRTKHR